MNLLGLARSKYSKKELNQIKSKRKIKHKKVRIRNKKSVLIKRYPPTKFNIGAFLFGPFYYFYHGMWGKGILYTIVALVLGTSIPIVGGIAVWVWAGFKHNKEYLEHKDIYVE